MLATIDRESTSLDVYVRRAEAWASTEAKPPTDKEIAIVGARAYARHDFRLMTNNNPSKVHSFRVRVNIVMDLITKAREKRVSDRDKRMNNIKKGLR